MKKILLFLVAIFIVSVKNTFAISDIVINEFSALSDPDWVEIYNSSSQAVNIDGWIIRDSTEANKIELSGYICSNSYRKFDFSNRLNNSGDTIRLLESESSSSPLDDLVYFSSSIPQHQEGQSTGREPQGSSTWQVFSTPTPNNDQSCTPSSPTPDPSPSSSKSPSPSLTTTTTATASAKKSPSPTPKKSPSPTPAPSKSPEVLGQQKDITQGFTDLAISGALNSPSPTPLSYYGSLTKNFSLILVGIGTIFIGLSFAFYMWYKKSLDKNSGINKGNERFEQEQNKDQ